MWKTLFLLMAVVALYGCASTMPWDIERNRDNLMNLEVGMSKQEVIGVMGKPYNREAYTISDRSILEFLIYLTKYTDSGSIPDSDTTPICFLNGKVTLDDINKALNHGDYTMLHIGQNLKDTRTVDYILGRLSKK